MSNTTNPTTTATDTYVYVKAQIIGDVFTYTAEATIDGETRTATARTRVDAEAMIGVEATCDYTEVFGGRYDGWYIARCASI